ATVGIICTSNLWQNIADGFSKIGVSLPARFWISQQVCAFVSVCIAGSVYAITSLLTSRKPFNLDKMLHRGIYAVEAQSRRPLGLRERLKLKNIFSFDSNFTRVDKFTAGGILWWALAMAALNVGITCWHFLPLPPLSMRFWAGYWMTTGVVIPFIIAAVTLVWFGFGGMKDIRDFFHAFRTMKRDARDDGRVVENHNLADEPTL